MKQYNSLYLTLLDKYNYKVKTFYQIFHKYKSFNKNIKHQINLVIIHYILIEKKQYLLPQ